MSGDSKPPRAAIQRRQREVVQRHDRDQAALAAALRDAAVVVERGERELSGLGLDPRPLDEKR